MTTAPADGMCFLHSVVLQLNWDSRFSVWDIAVEFLQLLSLRKPEWTAYVDGEYMDERVSCARLSVGTCAIVITQHISTCWIAVLR